MFAFYECALSSHLLPTAHTPRVLSITGPHSIPVLSSQFSVLNEWTNALVHKKHWDRERRSGTHGRFRKFLPILFFYIRLGQKSETNPVFQWFPLPAGPALFYPWCGPLLTRSVANLMLPFIPVKEKKTQIRTLITALVPFETLEGW